MAKQKNRTADVVRSPKFAAAFERAITALYQDRQRRGLVEGIRNFANGSEMWAWWISGLSVKKWCDSVGKEYIPSKKQPRPTTENKA